MDRLKSVELKAIASTLSISFFLCIIVAGIIYYSGLRETLLPTIGKIILAISIFTAGSYVSKFYANKGLVHGISVGIIFFILMLIATFIFSKSAISLTSFFYNLAVCLIAGGLGGILGIGLSDN
ncbi:MAG TPA: TIGR04086 family membrane protein [Syntrophomonadaceae bacterium]|nr:TIGR04086 family membrane protein [Syntrophomonadaceae bacterium]